MDRSRIKYPWDSLKAAGDSFETKQPVTKYMRAHITDLTTRAGLPPLVLPLMRYGSQEGNEHSKD